MTIQIDTREKTKAIQKILETFDKQEVKHYSSKLFVGDYMSLDNPRLVIDRKQNLLEIASNVSDVPKKAKDGKIKRYSDGRIETDRVRFTEELKRAKDNGIHIIILCENSKNIKTIEDVKNWINPRLKVSPLAMSGERLYTVLNQLMRTYDFDIVFCEKKDTGKEIIKLLGG